jgi:3-oxoacyl-[acyl-carrier protein] reductase
LPAVRASRLVVPAMRARGRGAIVNIVSIYGREWGGAYVRRPTYIAAKAAEIGMSKALAMELAPLGIRVNAVAPGSIVFPGGGWGGGPARPGQDRPVPQGRSATRALRPARGVGRVVAFLASDAGTVLGAWASTAGSPALF